MKVWLWRGGSTGAEETGANAGVRERPDGGRFVPLSFLVFQGSGEDTDVRDLGIVYRMVPS